ncbi:MAG: DUF5723 family protein [Fidelibacterota bacterium]
MKRITIFLALALTALPLKGQESFHPKAVSTAGTFADLARGSEALGWNPARLGRGDNPRFGLSFGVLPLMPFPRLELNNSTMNATWLNDNLYRGYFSSQDIQDLLQSIPDSGWEGSTQIQMEILGLSFGHFGFSVTPEIQATVNLPKDLFKLVFNGVRFEQPVELFDINVNVQGVIPVSFGYGLPLTIPVLENFADEFYVGAAVKPLIGLFNVRTTASEGSLTSFPDRIEADGTVEAKSAFGGFGFAADLGVGARLLDRFEVGLSLNNMFGQVRWSGKNTQVIRERLQGEILSSQFEDLQDDSLREDILNSIVQEDTTYAGSGYTTTYPTYLNVSGKMANVIPNLDVMVNYRQYFTSENYLSTTPRVSGAVQYRPLPWLAFRAGLALGGYESFQWGTGFGLQFTHYEFNFGFSQNNGMFNSARGMTISLGQTLLF